MFLCNVLLAVGVMLVVPGAVIIWSKQVRTAPAPVETAGVRQQAIPVVNRAPDFAAVLREARVDG